MDAKFVFGNASDCCPQAGCCGYFKRSFRSERVIAASRES